MSKNIPYTIHYAWNLIILVQEHIKKHLRPSDCCSVVYIISKKQLIFVEILPRTGEATRLWSSYYHWEISRYGLTVASLARNKALGLHVLHTVHDCCGKSLCSEPDELPQEIGIFIVWLLSSNVQNCTRKRKLCENHTFSLFLESLVAKRLVNNKLYVEWTRERDEIAAPGRRTINFCSQRRRCVQRRHGPLLGTVNC